MDKDIEELNKKFMEKINTWNRRYNELLSMMDSEPGRQEVIKILNERAKVQDLSYGERKMLHNAINWNEVQQELAKKVVFLDDYRKKKGA